MCYNYSRRGRPTITNPEWGNDADAYYHRQRKAAHPELDSKDEDHIGTLHTPRGDYEVYKDKPKFGFTKE